MQPNCMVATDTESCYDDTGCGRVESVSNAMSVT